MKRILILALVLMISAMFVTCGPGGGGNIKVSAPDGDVYEHGATMTIVFKVTADSGVSEVSIELWEGTEADGAVVGSPIAENVGVTDDGEDITKTYTVPSAADGTEYRVKISNAADATDYGISRTFSIYAETPTVSVTFVNAGPTPAGAPIHRGNLFFGPGSMLGYDPEADVSDETQRYLTPDLSQATDHMLNAAFNGGEVTGEIAIGTYAYFLAMSVTDDGDISEPDDISTYYGYFNYLDEYQFEDPSGTPPGDWVGYTFEVGKSYTITFNHDQNSFGYSISESSAK